MLASAAYNTCRLYIVTNVTDDLCAFFLSANTT
jgi:hypothetical protein